MADKTAITDESTGIADRFLAEFKRQRESERWSSEHDDCHHLGELALAAACYSITPSMRASAILGDLWPWEPEWWKPDLQNRERELVKAGGLLIAEMVRLKRQKNSPHRMADTCSRSANDRMIGGGCSPGVGEASELDIRIGSISDSDFEDDARNHKFRLLESENAKLREQLKLPHPARDFVNECNQLLAAKEAENAKLRDEISKLDAISGGLEAALDSEQDENAKLLCDYDGISGALVDAGDVTLYAGDLARSVRELVAQRDRLRDLLEEV